MIERRTRTAIFSGYGSGGGFKLRVAVITDRLDRAGIESFAAERGFLGSLRLFVNVGIAVGVVTGEISRRCIAAYIAVDTFTVDIESSENIVREPGFYVCHVRFYRIDGAA